MCPQPPKAHVGFHAPSTCNGQHRIVSCASSTCSATAYTARLYRTPNLFYHSHELAKLFCSLHILAVILT